nr:PREDICTED: uncharacterized protein LOC106703889 [Latimeria chalumnae]|eukprot:XP_014345161.1 PREDICTED: uncharacterized protein LOC106703889 [Latimeria chalumnae]
MLLLTVIILYVSTVNGKEFKVVQEPFCIDAVRGADVHLHCLFPPFKGSKKYITWEKKSGVQTKKFLNNLNITRRELSVGNATLSLTNVQPEDSGVYSCIVGGSVVTGTGNGTNLTVYDTSSSRHSQNREPVLNPQCVFIGSADEDGLFVLRVIFEKRPASLLSGLGAPAA